MFTATIFLSEDNLVKASCHANHCSHDQEKLLYAAEPTRIAQPPGGMIGSHDVVPLGCQPPGYGGLQELFPGGMGRSGGMHMGPDDPLFAGGSLTQ